MSTASYASSLERLVPQTLRRGQGHLDDGLEHHVKVAPLPAAGKGASEGGESPQSNDSRPKVRTRLIVERVQGDGQDAGAVRGPKPPSLSFIAPATSQYGYSVADLRCGAVNYGTREYQEVGLC